MKAVFMGLGYIGLPTAAVVASNGVEVIGVDTNPVVVDTINDGKIHIIEPNLDKIVKDVVTTGKLKASLVPQEADAFFIHGTENNNCLDFSRQLIAIIEIDGTHSKVHICFKVKDHYYKLNNFKAN